jgi:S1-C subfamily serine protease
MSVSLRRAGAAGLALAAAVVAAFASAQAAQASAAATPTTTPLERVQALVQPSIVYLQITFRGSVYDSFNKSWVNDGEPFESSAQCTGFVVNPNGYIATAGHCVEIDESARAAILGAAVAWEYENREHYERKDIPLEDLEQYATDDWRVREPEREVYAAYGVAASGLGTGKALPALVQGIRASDKGDAALLKINARDLTPLQLAPDQDLSVGTEVVSIGYPASVDLVADETFDPSFKEGTISSKKTIEGGLLQTYEISAAVSGGMSGGPTVDLQGRVIGMNSFGIVGESQAFNFVMPAEITRSVLADKGVANELGAVGKAYRAGVNGYFAGNRAAALTNLDKVLNLVPSHELAQEFRRKAVTLPVAAAPDSGGGGLPIVLLVGLAAFLLVGGGTAFVLVRRRSRPSPAGVVSLPPTPAVTIVSAPTYGAASLNGDHAPATATAPPDLSHRVASEGSDGSATAVLEAPAAPARTARFCGECGSKNTLAAKFCESCGERLGA